MVTIEKSEGAVSEKDVSLEQKLREAKSIFISEDEFCRFLEHFLVLRVGEIDS